MVLMQRYSMTARIVAVACLLCASLAHGETRYITDKLSIELRRGPGNQYLITRTLDAGLAVDVLEQTPDGYSRVSVPDGQGVEGWVLTRFLTTDRSARDRLAVAERTASDARARSAELERQVGELTTRLGDTKTELDHTRENHDHVSRELSSIKTAAANVVEIQEQNESLRQKLVDRDRQVEELTVVNGVLSGRNRQNWFVVGAAVLLGGIVIGLIAPSLRRKRRSEW
jgi:SH3 domain protein